MKKNKQTKICIITQYDLLNYGNRFQNVALGVFLKNYFGFDVYSLAMIIYPDLKHRVGYFVRKIQFVIRNLVKKNGWKFIKKKQSFYQFSKTNGLSYALLRPNWKDRLNRQFDHFIVGSDQIFSSEFGVLDYLSSLLFTEPHKRIAYAVSTGRGALNKEKYPLSIKSISEFNQFSVRETADQDVFKDVLGYIPSKLCDPVFLLNQKEWFGIIKNHVSKKAKQIAENGEFAFVYWLGPDVAEAKAHIENICKNQNLKTIWARTANTIDQEAFIDMSPYDFIYLLSKSKMVFSKSFHGCAMSIVFHKPFKGYDAMFIKKQKHDPRLQNLVDTFGVPQSVLDFYDENNQTFDWDKVDNNIVKAKKEALEFLKGAFENNEDKH